MSYGWWFLVILLTFLVLFFGTGWLLERGNARLERIRLLGQLEHGITQTQAQLPRAGRLELEPYGPFPVDTGPLLILSEQAAARADLEREIPRLCAEAEAKIPPRWRS